MNKLSLTETQNPATENIDLMDSLSIAQTINKEDQKVALAVEQTLPQIAQAIELIAQSFLEGGRLCYFGAGTSGRLGVLDASECWPTFGVSHEMVQGFIAGGDQALRYSIENAEDNAQLGLEDITHFAPTPKDVVVAISSCGTPKYLIAVLQEAKKQGTHTISISCNPDAPIKDISDIFINPIVGPEAITGSSRLKAGTAQKMVLNMLSTGAMIRIGKVYKNYMIDLRLVNEKLRKRGIRFVCEIAGCMPPQAEDYLAQANNEVKTACVIAIKQCSAEDARKLLAQERGILRRII